MPASFPPVEALLEFLGPSTRHTRRIEIYEQDGNTRWEKDTQVRLKGGSVSVNYARDERRGLDLVLSNDDGVLVNAPGEFWYDKIIKVFRGVEVNTPPREPRILVITDNTGENAQVPAFRSALADLGFGHVVINPLAASYFTDVSTFDIVVGLGDQNKGALLLEAYNAGKSVFTFRGSSEHFFNALQGGTTWAGVTLDTGDFVETRRNLAHSPAARTWGNNNLGYIGFHNNRQAGNVTYELVTGALDGPIPQLNTYARGTVIVNDTTNVGFNLTGQNPGGATPPNNGFLVVAANDIVRFSTYFRSSIPELTTIWRYRWASETAYIGNIIDEQFTLPESGWAQPQITLIAPDGATRLYVSLILSQNAPSGFVYEGTGLVIEKLAVDSESTGEYFDGNLPDADPVLYEWAGGVDTSHSIQRTLQGVSIAPLPVNDPRTTSWTAYTANANSTTYKAPAITVPDITGVAFASPAQDSYAITSGVNTVNGRFMALHYPQRAAQFIDEGFRLFLKAAVNWLNPVVPLAEWETQIGEFMIDRITEPHFPHEVRITGRDYTKKCMLSKFTQATQFAEGNSLESVIAAISIGAGITKRLLPTTGVVINRAFFFERGSSRWDAMKEICTAYSYEIFFDATGYLVIRPFRDPSTSAPIVYIKTGEDGQIVDFEKSTSDASLFNHVLVAGESSDSEVVPVWAERINTDPNSPTNRDEIGDRYWEFISAFVETQAQANQLAEAYLAVHQLEEFELNFSTLMMPWLEVGDIIGFVDPDPAPGDPSTFLLSSLSLPLELGPMSGSARRVTIVSGS